MFNKQNSSKLQDMNFSTFFSKQARKPSGLFGHFVMSFVFNKGNAILNCFVNEIISIQTNDHILDIGCGTGKLIYDMAKQINDGFIEGIDFSSSMVALAQKKNKKNMKDGKVKITEGDFDTLLYQNNFFDKICSVNTIYFWPEPKTTANKIASILKPGGFFVVAFEDIGQLEQKNLDKEVFHSYTADSVKNLLTKSGFSADISIKSKKNGKQIFHCVVAKK